MSLNIRASLTELSVSEPDVVFWLSRFEMVPQDALEKMLAMFSEFPEEITWFKDMQVKKEQALASHDSRLWEAIIKEEEMHLGTLREK